MIDRSAPDGLSNASRPAASPSSSLELAATRMWPASLPLLWIAGSRLLVVVAAFLAENLVSRNEALTSGDGAPILRSLTSWDGWWYLGIVRDGYHAAPVVGPYHDYAFLPLYPALVRLLSFPWPQFSGLIAVLLSNILFVVGLWLFVRLGVLHVGEEKARLAAVYLAIFPFSWVFSMAYTESLFLVLSVGGFLAAERDRRPLAGILIGLSALCRLQGAVLAVPLWLLWFARDGRRLRVSHAWAALPIVAALAFNAYVILLTGSTGAYGGAQAGWGRTGPGAAPSGGSIASGLDLYQLGLLVTLLVSVFFLVYLRRDRIRLAYGLMPIIFLLLELASGILEAVGRIVMLAFPYMWILANRRNRWFAMAWPAISVSLMFVLAVSAFSGHWVP